MKTISKIIIIVSALTVFENIYALSDSEIWIGDISFKDAVWDNYNSTLYSKQSLNKLSGEGVSTVLYFFEACMS